MFLTRRVWSGVLVGGLVSLGVPSLACAELKGLDIIAPANPGGGWDQTARAVQAALQADKLASGVKVENIGGAGGTIGLAQFVTTKSRNPNLLVWGGNVWLIDHGAALFTHHGWGDLESALAAAGSRFPQVRQHVLLPSAGPVDEADRRLAPRLTADVVEAAVAAVPDAWLAGVAPFATPEEHRAAYRAHLLRRLEGPRLFAEEAEAARRDLRG